MQPVCRHNSCKATSGAIVHDMRMVAPTEKTPAKIAFGERLRHAITAAGYRSAAAFAKKIQVSPQRLSNFTNGWRWPEPELLGLMCDHLSCTSDWLLYGKTSGLTFDFMERLRAAV